MIRKSPAERYIKYLLVHPNGYTDRQIFDRLVREGLDPLHMRYLGELRQELQLPEVYYPYDPTHKGTRRFLRSHEIYGLFHPTRATEQAVRLLGHGRSKEHIESMALIGLTANQIERTIQRFAAWQVTTADVEAYLYYFFDIESYDATDLRALIELRAAYLETSEDEFLRSLAAAMKRANWRDARRAAANLPDSPVTALIVQVQQGFDVPKADLQKILEKAKQLLVLRAYEEICMAGPEMGMKVGSMFAAVESIDRTIERSIDPNAQLRSHFEAMMLRTDGKAMPDVAQVSQGRHSVPLLPVSNSDDTAPAQPPATNPTGR